MIHVKITVAIFLSAISFSQVCATLLISDFEDQYISENASTSPIYFVVGDDENIHSLLVDAISSNPELVPNTSSGLKLSGTNAHRSLIATPLPDRVGEAIITVSVENGEGVRITRSFKLVVTEPNTPPVIRNLPEFQIVPFGASGSNIRFEVTDAETDSGDLVLELSSDNPAMLPDENLEIISNAGNERLLRVTPVAGQTGVALVTLLVTDGVGAYTRENFIFCVFDVERPNSRIVQPYGIYVLDSSLGRQMNGVSMRDANLVDKLFVDGYVLRTGWAVLEPSDGDYDFTIIDNIFSKLPFGQKLSLILVPNSVPEWVSSLPEVVTWVSNSVIYPSPWDLQVQERYARMLEALGTHEVDGVALRDRSDLVAVNSGFPPIEGGIRDMSVKLRDIPGYSRENMEACVMNTLGAVRTQFPKVPVFVGFWTYEDWQDSLYGGKTPWVQLRDLIVTTYDGVSRPEVGFWMENLAASRPFPYGRPVTGFPRTTYAASLYTSQEDAFVGLQMLGSWSRPFAYAHIPNNLNGRPEDAMSYAFSTYQTRYFEVYREDVDFAGYTGAFQRWHNFLNAMFALDGSSFFSDIQVFLSLVSDGTVVLEWPTVPGCWYDLQMSSDLVSWQSVGQKELSLSGEPMHRVDAASFGKMFYRVLRSAQ